jgi:hypothetical protein
MERVEGRTTRISFVPAATQRTKNSLARGQASSNGCSQPPHIPFALHDGRTSQTLGSYRHQQYQHSQALHLIRSQRLGQHTQPRKRQGRLAPHLPHIHLLGLTVGPPLHRQICHARQQATASLQCPLAKPIRRSNGLPTYARHALDVGNQLVQPSVDAPTRLRSKVTPIWRRYDSHHTVLARQIAVPTTERTFRRIHIVPPLPRFILSAQARSVRWRRTARLERHDVPRTTPTWLYRSRETLKLAPTARRSAPRSKHVRTSSDNNHPAAPVKY